MTTRTDFIKHVERFLLRCGETQFAASVLAETITDAAIALSNANPLGENLKPMDYINKWIYASKSTKAQSTLFDDAPKRKGAY
jgi:hypothetical protein